MSSSKTKQYSSLEFRLINEGGDGVRSAFSIRSPCLPVFLATTDEKVKEMMKTPEKYKLVSEEMFFKLISYLAPLCRGYQRSGYGYTFEKRFETRNDSPPCQTYESMNPEYLDFFEKEDLESKSLELPSMLYSREWTWFIYIDYESQSLIAKILDGGIKSFIKNEEKLSKEKLSEQELSKDESKEEISKDESKEELSKQELNEDESKEELSKEEQKINIVPSETKEYSSLEFVINGESGNDDRCAISIRTPRLPVDGSNYKDKVSEMLKTPEKYELVSEEIFYRLISRLAPFCRQYQTFEFNSTFKERFESHTKSNLEYLKFFEEEDLCSTTLALPGCLYNKQRTWFVYFSPVNASIIGQILQDGIKIFIEMETKRLKVIKK
jgi:hypothetical protein